MLQLVEEEWNAVFLPFLFLLFNFNKLERRLKLLNIIKICLELCHMLAEFAEMTISERQP